MRRFFSQIILFLLPLFKITFIFAQSAPNIGYASRFALFTCAGNISNAHICNIIGDLGTNSGVNSWYGNTNGNLQFIVPDSPTVYCSSAVTLAYLDAAGRTAMDTISGLMGPSDTVKQGVHKVYGNATLSGNLIFNAAGNPSAVFIIQVTGSVNIAPGARMILLNGALACNVFWQISDSLHTAANDSVKGTFLCNGPITLGSLNVLEGRAFTINGNVFADSSRVFIPLGCNTAILMGPVSPDFGQAGCFDLFTDSGQITNPGGSSSITGNIGCNGGGSDPTPYFPGIPGTVDYRNSSTSSAALSISGLWLYANNDSLRADIVLSYPALLGYGLILTPHTYILDTNTLLTDTLLFDAENNTYAIFIVQVNGSLTTAPNSVIRIINQARAANIFWMVNGGVSLGANSTFKGTIISNNGACSVAHGVNLEGRLFAMNGPLSFSGASSILPVDGFASCELPFINHKPVAHNDTESICQNDTGFIMHVQSHDHDTDLNSLTNFIISGPYHGNAYASGVNLIYTPDSGFTGNDSLLYRILDDGIPPLGDTALVYMRVNPLPVASAGDDTAVCLNDTLVLGDTTQAGVNYLWRPLAGIGFDTTAQPRISPTVTTTFYLFDTIRRTGCFNFDSVVVTINPLPVVISGMDTVICRKDSVLLGAAPSSGYTYYWRPSTGLSDTNLSVVMATPSVTTTYMLTDTILATGCFKTDTVIIAVKPLPIAHAGPDSSICSGKSMLVGDTARAGTLYFWKPPAGLNLANIAQPLASPTITTTYVLLDSNILTNCINTDTVKITVNLLPVVFAGRDTAICQAQTVMLGAATIPGYHYSWSPATGLSSAGISQPFASPSVTTTYLLTDSILATGCIKSDTVTITVKPIPLAIAGSDTIICAGDSITLGAPAISGDTYIWMPAQGLNSVSVGMPVASPEVTTVYTLTETNSLCPNSNTVLITVNPLPAAFTGPDQSIPPHASITIGGPPVAGNTYAWLPAADISSASNSQPEINPMSTTTYTLTETIDATGCRQTNTLVITVKEPEFFNAFSPNGDGVNDTWEIPVLNFFPQNKVIILNRWGSEVWETSDYDNKNKVFAGKNRGGDELPDGTYYYNITYGNEEKQGWVLIKR